jgi:hypothetical protein
MTQFASARGIQPSWGKKDCGSIRYRKMWLRNPMSLFCNGNGKTNDTPGKIAIHSWFDLGAASRNKPSQYSQTIGTTHILRPPEDRFSMACRERGYP